MIQGMMPLRTLLLVPSLLALIAAACSESTAENEPTVVGSGGKTGSAGKTGGAGSGTSGQSGEGGQDQAGGAQAGGAQAGSAQAGSGQAGSAQAGGGQAGTAEGGAGGEEPGGAGGSSGGAAGGGNTAGSGGQAPKVCECFSGDGPYCAASVKEWLADKDCEVPVLAGHGGDLLQCKGGQWTVKSECASGCDESQPGETDACNLPDCPCFVQSAWCGTGAAKEGLSMNPPCRVPLVPEHNDDILACNGTKWIVKQSCDKGCIEAPKGTPDSCKSNSSYKLPWKCGTTQTCTQANFGSSHQGTQKYAWDFGMKIGTPVHAVRGGTVKYIEMRSPPGSTCYNPSGINSACHNKANFIGIKHSDGTVALYMHLSAFSVKKGDQVAQGDKIGLSGNSGYTSGPHLHFQLQNDCGIWFCQSVPVKFGDAPNLTKGASVTSGNCP